MKVLSEFLLQIVLLLIIEILTVYLIKQKTSLYQKLPFFKDFMKMPINTERDASLKDLQQQIASFKEKYSDLEKQIQNQEKQKQDLEKRIETLERQEKNSEKQIKEIERENRKCSNQGINFLNANGRDLESSSTMVLNNMQYLNIENSKLMHSDGNQFIEATNGRLVITGKKGFEVYVKPNIELMDKKDYESYGLKYCFDIGQNFDDNNVKYKINAVKQPCIMHRTGEGYIVEQIGQLDVDKILESN